MGRNKLTGATSGASGPPGPLSPWSSKVLNVPRFFQTHKAWCPSQHSQRWHTSWCPWSEAGLCCQLLCCANKCPHPRLQSPTRSGSTRGLRPLSFRPPPAMAILACLLLLTHTKPGASGPLLVLSSLTGTLLSMSTSLLVQLSAEISLFREAQPASGIPWLGPSFVLLA